MGNAQGTAGLPFDVGAEVTSYANGSQSHWAMHKGTKRANGEKVTIFRLTKKPTLSPILLEAGQRGFSKLRALRHPYILPCLDGADLDTEIVMATEEVVPLAEWLANSIETGKKEDQVAWGMYCVFSALRFLHEQSRQSHNNISLDTIFVTKGGDWKLGGMDLLCALDGSDPFLQLHQSVQPRAFQSPERQSGNMRELASDPIHCCDIWAFAQVLKRVYSEGIPASLTKYLEKMETNPPSKRPTSAQYLKCVFLKRPSVAHQIGLEEWNVKSHDEKQVFLKGGEILKACPSQVVANKLGPLLIADIEAVVSAASAPPGAQVTASGNASLARATIASSLPPLLDISKDDTEAGEGSLAARLQPLLVALFTMNDRGVRAMLLSKVDQIAPRLDAATVNGKLFDSLCAGFGDAAAQLRELTLKGMVAFTDKLSEKNMNDKLIRHLSKLQGDPEDSIRTNTIIFLGKISSKLKPAVRDKVLLDAFARGIKDPFPAARLAGLKSTTACASQFNAAEVCRRVLPSVMPCLLDPTSAAVRDASFACVDAYLTTLRGISEQMKVEEEERRVKELSMRIGEGGGIGEIHLSNNTHNINNNQSYASNSYASPPPSTGITSAPTSISSRTSMSGGTTENAGSSSGWGSWAVGILSDKLSSATAQQAGGDTPTKPQTSTSTYTPGGIQPPAQCVDDIYKHKNSSQYATNMNTNAHVVLPTSDDDEFVDTREHRGDGWDEPDLDLDSDLDASPKFSAKLVSKTEKHFNGTTHSRAGSSSGSLVVPTMPVAPAARRESTSKKLGVMKLSDSTPSKGKGLDSGWDDF